MTIAPESATFTDLPYAKPLAERMDALKAELALRQRESSSTDDQLALHSEELQVAEEELRQSLESLQAARRASSLEALRFRGVFDLAPDPLFVTDARGLLVDANRSAGELVAAPEPGWAGVALQGFLHPDDVKTFEGALAAVEKGPCRVRLRFRGKNGRSMRGSVRGTLTRELGQVLWTVRVERGGRTEGGPPPSSADTEKRLGKRVQELEQEVAARERAVHAERHVREDMEAQAITQQRAMAIVAHEATNVMRCIASWAQPLVAVATGPTAEGLRAIAWSAQVELEILRDLTDVARIATQQLRSSFVPVDLVDVSRRAVAAMAPRAEAARVELGGSFLEAMEVQGEPTRLAQLLLDVLAMSIALTGSGGRVSILGVSTPSEVSVVVSRTGRELRPDELAWSLDRVQADASVAISGRGAGMSLFIARQLVELHSGRLVAQAATAEAGASVKLVFPRSRSGSFAPAPRSTR